MRDDEYLLLDSAIRDWVLLPIILMLILVAAGRHYVHTLIKSEPKVKEKDLPDIRFKQTLMLSSILRGRNNFISDKAFNMRKAHLTKKKVGLLSEKCPPPANPMSNPFAMMDMMKGNITFMIPNIAMMSFVGHFFSGFVCLKLPFPMPSNHFKLMLQRGVDLNTLDVSYVSSLCWYFLGTFCLHGVLSLLLGDDRMDDFQMQMGMQMGMGMGGGGQMGFDAKAAFRQEKELVSITKHVFEGPAAERRLLGERYPDPHNRGRAPLNLPRLNVKA